MGPALQGLRAGGWAVVQASSPGEIPPPPGLPLEPPPPGLCAAAAGRMAW